MVREGRHTKLANTTGVPTALRVEARKMASMDRRERKAPRKARRWVRRVVRRDGRRDRI